MNEAKTERRTMTSERESTKGMKILGSFINIEEEIAHRKRLAEAAFNKHHHVMTNRSISVRNRVRAYNVFVRPVLLYNCQTWEMTEKHEEKLESFERRLLRRCLRSFYQPGVKPMSSAEVMKRTDQMACGEEVRKRRWSYLGHNIRHEGPAKRVMEEYEGLSGRRKKRRGRPMKNLATIVKAEMAKRGVQAEDAADRAAWRNLAPKPARRGNREKRTPSHLKDYQT